MKTHCVSIPCCSRPYCPSNDLYCHPVSIFFNLSASSPFPNVICWQFIHPYSFLFFSILFLHKVCCHLSNLLQIVCFFSFSVTLVANSFIFVTCCYTCLYCTCIKSHFIHPSTFFFLLVPVICWQTIHPYSLLFLSLLFLHNGTTCFPP